MKLEECFERVAVISLPFKSDRRRRLKKHLEENGITHPKKISWQRAICGDWTPPPDWWGAGNGAWGCLMSHLRLGQDAVHDKLDSCCVLEDDVVFHPQAPEMLERFMRELPSDWGQVYLGGQFLHQEPEPVSPWVVRPFNVNRTHAFALSKETIPRFLQHIMHAPDYFDLRVDDKGAATIHPTGRTMSHQLGRAHERRDWNTYAPAWWIAGQTRDSSNISGDTNEHLWWHWRGRGAMLPFFFLPPDAGKKQRATARRHLHAGYNLQGNSLTDIGLAQKLDDDALRHWLGMIAGEAVERWRLPGFEVPEAQPDLPARVRHLWEPGLLEAEDPLMKSVAGYPFNGFCGSLPDRF